MSGFFFGFAFGLGGIGAALLGKLTDITSINFVYHACAFLPVVGILGAFLPNLNPAQNRCDALIARSPSSGLDWAVRLALAKIHFFSTDVTRCLRLCKVRFLPRDFPSITVRWACK